MKNVLLLISFLTFISFTPFNFVMGAPPLPKGRGNAKPVFPHYPSRATRPGPVGKPPMRAAIPGRQDTNGNRVNDDHLHRVDFANHRATEVMRSNPHVNNHVAYHSAVFVSTLHPIYQQKSTLYNEHFDHYHTFIHEHPLVWQDWHRHHFYGGFYYGFHPVPDIQIYFYNPMVHWFYVGTWDDEYYRTWYGSEYAAYPQLNHPFEFYGVYYPTDNLRQLLFAVSAMPVDKQAVFRTEISNFTQQLTQQMANQLKAHVVLSKGDIVITHYETLGYDDAIVLEGFVNNQSKSSNFKGMIQLDAALGSSNKTQVFVAASSGEEPNADQLKSLDALNVSIANVSGVATEEKPEAKSVDVLKGRDSVYPSQTPEYPVSAESSADPK